MTSDQVERLRASLAMVAGQRDELLGWQRRAEKAEAENAKLRAALRELGDLCCRCTDEWTCLIHRRVQEALTPQPGPGMRECGECEGTGRAGGGA